MKFLILTIHQPTFLPYPGFFHKLTLADTFVVLDNTQFNYDETNRNKIISNAATWTRISIPIKNKHKFLPIKSVEIDNTKNWQQKNWELILSNYKETNFFHLYHEYFEKLFDRKWNYIFDINFDIIKKCIEWLDIKIEIIKESDLSIDGKSTEKLVNICKELGAQKYISGPGGKNYLDEKLFFDNKIKLEYQSFFNKPYPQNSKTFVPNLSIIDMLANIGPKSKNFLIE